MRSRSIITGLIWVAAIIFALVWASRPNPALHSLAHAGMTASRGGFTLLTAGSLDQRVQGEAEAIYVIDHHRGLMLVYGLSDLQSSPGITMLDGGRIEVLFERARGHGRGGATP